jgi:hypothetical protein
MTSRREDRAGDCGEFAPAERRRYFERIAKDGAMKIERGLDRCAFARKPGIVNAGATAGPPAGASAE